MKINIYIFLFSFFLLPNIVPSQNYWTQLNGPYGGSVLDIEKHLNGNLYIIRNEAAYVSTDNGLSWNEFDNATLGSNLSMGISSSGVIYLGKSTAGIWWSANLGQTWNFNSINIAPHSGTWVSVYTLGISPSGVIYANNWRSFNGGSSFTQFTIAQGAFPYSYAFSPSGNVFAAANNGVYRSNDNGSSWSNMTGDLPQTYGDNILYENENSIFVTQSNAGIFKTSNSGANWNLMNNGLTDLNVSTLYLKDGKLFAGTESGKLFISTNSGVQWTLFTDMPDAGQINSVYNEGNDLFIASNQMGINFSQDNGLNWTERNLGLYLTSLNELAFGPNKIFAASNNGVLYSPDNGNTWLKRNTDLPSNFINTIYNSSADKLFAGIQNFGIYVSTNNGNSWSASNNGITVNGIIKDIKEASGFLYALRSNSTASDSVFLYRSSNNGESWQNIFSSTGFFLDNFTIDVQGKLYIGGKDATFQAILYSSTTNGETWSHINYPSSQLMFSNFTSAGSDLYMTGSFNVMKSTNAGVNWFDMSNGNWNSNAQPGRMNVNSRGDIFLNINSSIYLTTNNGVSWVERISGISSNTNMKKFIFDSDGFLYNITFNNGIYRSIESTITGITASHNEIPNEFMLYQNYPNPFNPSTMISFSIPTSGFVNLNVYDISGRLMEVLINETIEAGNHNITFDGSGLSSGVYFYKLEAGEYKQTKRMLMIK